MPRHMAPPQAVCPSCRRLLPQGVTAEECPACIVQQVLQEADGLCHCRAPVRDRLYMGTLWVCRCCHRAVV
jgi:hypothetical protein